jgi:hypothetical protein
MKRREPRPPVARASNGGRGASVTYDDLLRHAKTFGADCVVETAEQHGLPRREVLLLKLRCSELKPLKGPKGSPLLPSVGKRLTKEESHELVWLLSDEGLTSSEIVSMTGLSARQVGLALMKREETSA